MTKTNLKDRLRSPLLLLDGGMGSQLMARQVVVTRGTDCLNLENPSAVQAIHADYVQAGADAILTNTLGANPITLARHDLADRCAAINEAGARIARQAAGPDRYVLGDIGSCGEFLEPLGTLSPDRLRSAFAAQAKALKAGGVDGFIIETMTALDEAAAAVEVVRTVCDLPVLASMAFEATAKGYRTIMGVDVQTAVSTLVGLGVDAVGFNCGTATLDQYVDLAEAFVHAVQACAKEVPVYAEPNAGRPRLEDGQAVWAVTPDSFARALQRMYAKGIHILGGCCGTGPEHIRAVASLLHRSIEHRR